MPKTKIDSDLVRDALEVDQHYLDLYRDTLKEIAHSPEYLDSGPCPDDQSGLYETSTSTAPKLTPIRCPRCLAREVLGS